MEHREGSKDTVKQQGVFMVFSKRRLNSFDVFRHSVEKPCTTQPVSSIVFESSYITESSKQNSEKEFNYLLVWSSILCLIEC